MTNKGIQKECFNSTFHDVCSLLFTNISFIAFNFMLFHCMDCALKYLLRNRNIDGTMGKRNFFSWFRCALLNAQYWMLIKSFHVSHSFHRIVSDRERLYIFNYFGHLEKDMLIPLQILNLSNEVIMQWKISEWKNRKWVLSSIYSMFSTEQSQKFLFN